MKQIKILKKMLSEEVVTYKSLEELFDIKNGYTPSKKNPNFWTNGQISWFRLEDLRTNGLILENSLIKVTQEAVKKSGPFKANSIILATTATIGIHALITKEFLCNQQFTVFQIKKDYENKILIKFYFHYFYIIDEWCKNNTKVSAFPAVDIGRLKKMKIPLPSLALQQHIVEVLDKFSELTAELTAELDLRKKQYQYCLNKIFNFENIRYKNLKEIVKIKRGKRITKKDLNPNGKYLVISGGANPFGRYDQFNCPKNTITIAKYGTAGYINWQTEEFWANDVCYSLFPTSEIKNRFLYYYLISIQDWIYLLVNKQATPTHLEQTELENIEIPVPPLEKQNQIVNILDTFTTLIEDLDQGIPAEINLRQQQYEYYRNLLLTFKTEDEIDEI